jgi:hypothetical protein
MTATQTRTVVVPDLDDSLIDALHLAEELLLLGRSWELEAREDGDEEWQLPAPLAGGAALQAVHRLWRALAATQLTESWGRRYTGPQWYAANGTYELAPLSCGDRDRADLDLLARTAQELGRPGRRTEVAEVAEVADEYADNATTRRGHPRTLSAAEAIATIARPARPQSHR